MNYRIVKKEAFRIVGYKSTEKMTMDNCFEICPKLWAEVGASGGIPKLLHRLLRRLLYSPLYVLLGVGQIDFQIPPDLDVQFVDVNGHQAPAFLSRYSSMVSSFGV